MKLEAASAPVLTVEGPRATIRINRPDHANRLQPEDLAALVAAFDRIEAMDDVRVLVVTGTGRIFSSGFHLGAIKASAPEEGEDGVAFETVADRLETLRVPTICRLNGGVYGGATDLALACDFRIGTETCQMFMPAARLGLHYYRSGLVRYVSRLGPDVAKRLFLTAERIDAAEMLRIGFLTQLVPSAELDQVVDALAQTLCANAPHAVQNMKRTINEIAHGCLDEAEADRRHRDSLNGDELKEGAAAITEKRPPRF